VIYEAAVHLFELDDEVDELAMLESSLIRGSRCQVYRPTTSDIHIGVGNLVRVFLIEDDTQPTAGSEDEHFPSRVVVRSPDVFGG
jgi:hypothetical protein